jgi:hypothetical protein
LKCSTIEEFNAHAEIVTALIRRGFHELSIDLRTRHESAICETYLGCIDWTAPAKCDTEYLPAHQLRDGIAQTMK